MSHSRTQIARDDADWQEEDSGSGTGPSTTSSASDEKSYSDDPTNLIVNYLPVYFNEEHLRDLFKSYGQIESLIVMYNKHDYRKKSKGYGFVKFSTPEEAQAAIKGVDGTRIANKTVKVSIARPGRARRASNVFVSRLPVTWRDADLQAAFKTFGHIVECRVLTFGDGVSRRCGFVRYDSDDEAKLAMKKMKNFRPSPRDAPLQVNLSVNHSPDARTIAQAEKEMAMSGYLTHGRFGGMRDMDYGHPWMSNRADYMSALRAGRDFSAIDEFMYGGRPPFEGMPYSGPPHMNHMMDPLMSSQFGGYHDYYHGYDGFPSRSPLPGDGYNRSTSARSNSNSRENYRSSPDTFGPTRSGSSSAHETIHSQSSPESIASTAEKTQVTTGPNQRLFVQGLPPFYEEAHLRQLFSSYGDVSSVTVQRDKNGKSIQCAFVIFVSADDAQRAQNALNEVKLSENTLTIHIM